MSLCRPKNYVLYWNFDLKSWFAYFCTHFTREKRPQINFFRQIFSLENSYYCAKDIYSYFEFWINLTSCNEGQENSTSWFFNVCPSMTSSISNLFKRLLPSFSSNSTKKLAYFVVLSKCFNSPTYWVNCGV